MLVNLVGPPAAGKTLHAQRFVSEYPEFSHLAIDDYRITWKDEDQAWYELMCAAANAPHNVVESSGLSWKLEAWILSHIEIERRGILTVVLYGNTDVFTKRLLDRRTQANRPTIPFKYKGLSEEGLILRCNDKLPEMYPCGYFLKTDYNEWREETYNEMKEVILSYKRKLEECM
jgi:adenylate kinase family enzyme